jgi:hypothetical protein
MSYVEASESTVDKQYVQEKIKRSFIHYQANTLTYTMENGNKHRISVVFQVSNNDIAFRYELAPMTVRREDRLAVVVEKEAT